MCRKYAVTSPFFNRSLPSSAIPTCSLEVRMSKWVPRSGLGSPSSNGPRSTTVFAVASHFWFCCWMLCSCCKYVRIRSSNVPAMRATAPIVVLMVLSVEVEGEAIFCFRQDLRTYLYNLRGTGVHIYIYRYVVHQYSYVLLRL